MLLLGLDVGNSGCKAGVYDDQGTRKARTYREYSAAIIGETATIDPMEVWDAVAACIREIPAKIRDQIGSLAVSSMSDSLILLDQQDRVMGLAILSYDGRAGSQAGEFSRQFGAADIFSQTGLSPHPMHMASKCRWLLEHHPEKLEAAAYILSFEDFLLRKLGSEPAVSFSTAARSMLFDVNEHRFIPALVRWAGLREGQLPKAFEGGTAVGQISKSAAQVTGLAENVTLVAGGFDQTCCAIAGGIFLPGQLLDTTGTNEILYFPLEPKKPERLFDANMNVSHHFLQTQAAFAQVWQAGGALKWIRGLLSAFSGTACSYETLLASLPNEPTGVFFLPFLAGSGTPDMQPRRRAALHHLSIDTTGPMLVKAILEGICYEMAYNMDMISGITGMIPRQVCAAGGATASNAWMQLKADISGQTFSVYKNLDPGTAGAAMFAGIGAGVFAGPQEGFGAISSHLQRKTYPPTTRQFNKYAPLREAYASLRAQT